MNEWMNEWMNEGRKEGRKRKEGRNEWMNFIATLFAHVVNKDQNKFYQFMNYSPLNQITNIPHIFMEKSMHVYVSI
jgi:hypothetical protein